MKKEKTLELLLWSVVFYALAILAYYTLKLCGHSADYISAFGSILSGVATIFASYVAISLYSDWRDPYNKNIEKELIFDVISKYSEMNSSSLELLTHFEDFNVDKELVDNDIHHPEFIFSEIKSLDIQLSAFSSKYNLYYDYSRIDRNTEFDKKITAVRRTIFEIDRQKEQDKINYIKHRLKHDLIEFNDYFNECVIINLMNKLKTDK